MKLLKCLPTRVPLIDLLYLRLLSFNLNLNDCSSGPEDVIIPTCRRLLEKLMFPVTKDD